MFRRQSQSRATERTAVPIDRAFARQFAARHSVREGILGLTTAVTAITAVTAVTAVTSTGACATDRSCIREAVCSAALCEGGHSSSDHHTTTTTGACARVCACTH